jgi:hypothetical protein
MTTYLERYRAGDHQQVWTDLVALGPAVRQEPLYMDAMAVAREMMTRARHNIALLVERLPALDYRFAEPRRVWEPPRAQLLTQVDQTEQQYGPMPLVLRQWFEVVGEVSLMGSHPRLSSYVGLDPRRGAQPPVSEPLVIGWSPVSEDYSTEEPSSYIFPLAPDACHKANMSGSGPTCVELPIEDFDGQFVGEDVADGMYLVPYLRLCFQWGGFPGLADDDEAAEAARAELEFLTRDLLLI